MTDISVSPGPPDAIAVIGMAGRFPGAASLPDFWANLRQGRRGIRELSREELLAAGATAEQIGQPGYVPARGVLAAADCFDAAFFGLSPREADLLDPQHRVFLECAWHALENAGVVAAGFPGRVGVFAGSAFNTYLLRNVATRPDVVDTVGDYQILLSADKDFLSSRVAYHLGLTGPAVTVQTACSTSLSAIHLGCQSLLSGETDIALAGGVSVAAPIVTGYVHEEGGILSPDGHCRAFDAGAAGTVPGNGVGVVVLRRLDDALAAGDRVDAVVRGSAWNNDGNAKVGYTAPGVDGQCAVITEALEVAGVSAETVDYVEAHGTGTRLGDPIEIAALTQAFRAHTQRTDYCHLGSVKASVGHLDAAAGVVSFIKTVLMLRHAEFVPSADFATPNPQLDLARTPFRVCDANRPWPSPDGRPRRAGVSSFGIGGTNVHVVLEESPRIIAPPTPRAGPAAAVQFRLSGTSPESVRALAGSLADHLGAHPDLAPTAVAETLRRGRTRLGWTAIVTAAPADIGARLRALRPEEIPSPSQRAHRVAFLFPGQGSQYAGMAASLADREPRFRAALDEALAALARAGATGLRPLLLHPGDGDDERLRNTLHAQPALFAVEYALARLCIAAGLVPSAMAGHSLGEFTAATIAGVFTLDGAASVVAERARLMATRPTGAMVALVTSETDARRWLTEEVAIAAVNSDRSVVLSGPAAAIESIEHEALAAGLGVHRLHTSHAFHSPAMAPVGDALARWLHRVELAPPTVPIASNVTGTWLTDAEATSPDYWVEHLRTPVRFADDAALLLAEQDLAFVELGPGATLTSLLKASASWSAQHIALSTMPRATHGNPEDGLGVQRAVGTLAAAGVPIPEEDAGRTAPPVDLPGYPFQRTVHWLRPSNPGRTAQRPEVRFTRGTWVRHHQVEPARSAVNVRWLVLDTASSGSPEAAELTSALTEGGGRVVTLHHQPPGHLRGPVSAGPTGIDLHSRDDLLDQLAGLGLAPDATLHVVVLSGAGRATPKHTADSDADALSAALSGPFAALLALAQALEAYGHASVQLDVVTAGVHAVTGDEDLHPENALALGVCTVAPQEIDGVRARLLDAPRCPTGELVRQLCQEPDEPVLAWRGRHWWRPGDEPLPWHPLQPADRSIERLRANGVFVLSGGLGDMALACAAEILSRAERPTFVLLARSDPAAGGAERVERRQRALQALRDGGAVIDIKILDVTRPPDVRAALTDVRRHHGAINGVIHAAGLPATGPLPLLTLDACRKVILAKAAGAQALVSAVSHDDLDFFLLCSSVTSILGGPGQTDYCAANNYLNSYAEAVRASTSLPIAAVAWGTWADTGMARAGRLGAPDRDAQSWSEIQVLSTAESWIVDDHRLAGHGLVPGTAYLAFASTALRARFPGQTVELADVVFLEPSIVPDGTVCTIATTFTPREDGAYAFTVSGHLGSGPRRDHAAGVARVLPSQDTAGTRIDPDSFLPASAVGEVIDTEAALRRRLHADRYTDGTGPLQFHYGPRWETVRSIRTDGHSRLVGTLELPAAMAGDLLQHPLHPALLDAAGGIFRVHAPDGYFLPLAYRLVRVHADLTRVVHCLVTITGPMTAAQETLGCTITLVDDDGGILVELIGFTIKQVGDLPALLRHLEEVVAESVTPRPDQPGHLDSRLQTGSAALAALSRRLPLEEARGAFAALARNPSPPPVTVVTLGDLTELRSVARTLTPATLEEELSGVTGAGERHPRPSLDTEYAPPTTDVERAVAESWSEILGVDGVGVDDDFFALGGHSLAAVQVSSRLKQRFAVDLDLSSIFEAPTVAQTARVIEQALARPVDAAGQDEIPILDRSAPTRAALRDLSDEDIEDLTEEEIDALLRDLDAEETVPTWPETDRKSQE